MVTNNSSNIKTGLINTVLQGEGVGVTPLFTATPTVTSLSFGNTALSTYIEGTWTPNLQISGSNTGITYSTQLGWYTQINNAVFVMLRIVLSSQGSNTGTVTINNFPVSTGASGSAQSFSISKFGGVSSTGGYTGLCFVGQNNSTVMSIDLTSTTNGMISTVLTGAVIASNFAVTGFGLYYIF
jgi:hypothetical protein